ncbi:MAG: hypothetical protein F4X94_07175, partial [Dehalococcoidia bacterium]|nr:hypothetical protein [Dehalococcoidia bacterium]
MSRRLLLYVSISLVLVLLIISMTSGHGTSAQEPATTPTSDETATTVPTPTGTLVVAPGSVQVGQTATAVGFHVDPPDLKVRIEYSDHFVPEDESCSTGSPSPTQAMPAPTWVTLNACSVGDGYVRLVASDTGQVIRSESVTVTEAGPSGQSSESVTISSFSSSLQVGHSDSFTVETTGLNSGTEYTLNTTFLNLTSVAFNSGCTTFSKSETFRGRTAQNYTYSAWGCRSRGTYLYAYLQVNGSVVAANRLSNHYITVVTPTPTPSPEPEVTITANKSSITEGDDIEFTVTLNNAPSSELTVKVSVTQSGSYISGTPPTSVTIAARQTTVSFTIETDDDDVDESDGSITAQITDADGYDVGSPSSKKVPVSDNDSPSSGPSRSPT